MDKSTFEEELERTGRLVYTNLGNSMMPLIRQQKDLIIIKQVKEPLKRYDVPLYKRDSGEYVLHRILKVNKQGYVLCGDNRWNREYGITDKHIIGVLDGIVRDGEEIAVSNWKYRLYAHIWCDFFWMRAFILMMKQWKKRIMVYWKKRRYRS